MNIIKKSHTFFWSIFSKLLYFLVLASTVSLFRGDQIKSPIINNTRNLILATFLILAVISLKDNKVIKNELSIAYRHTIQQYNLCLFYLASLVFDRKYLRKKTHNYLSKGDQEDFSYLLWLSTSLGYETIVSDILRHPLAKHNLSLDGLYDAVVTATKNNHYSITISLARYEPSLVWIKPYNLIQLFKQHESYSLLHYNYYRDIVLPEHKRLLQLYKTFLLCNQKMVLPPMPYEICEMIFKEITPAQTLTLPSHSEWINSNSN